MAEPEAKRIHEFSRRTSNSQILHSEKLENGSVALEMSERVISIHCSDGQLPEGKLIIADPENNVK